jgi:hypothetical protein
LNNNLLGTIALIVWQGGSIVTFFLLTFFDHYNYTWWNWIFALPINAFLGEMWPIYWLILRPIMGH